MSDRSTPSPDRLLNIYLQDHLAGAAAGTARWRRLVRTSSDHPAAAEFRELARELAHDYEALQRFAGELRVPPAGWKRLLTRTAEWLGTAKLNGRLIRRSPLGVLVDLEMLRSAAVAKLSLFESLQSAGIASITVDLNALEQRTRHQVEAITKLHNAEAARLWGRGDPEPP